jgi:hypothetical protein
MNFTSSRGVLGVRLRTGPFQESAGACILQLVGKKSFFKQQSFYGALEKQARNRTVSGKNQARIRRPCLIAAGWGQILF